MFVAGGILMTEAGLFAGDFLPWAPGVVIAVCALGAVIYSYLEWRKEKRAPAV